MSQKRGAIFVQYAKKIVEVFQKGTKSIDFKGAFGIMLSTI